MSTFLLSLGRRCARHATRVLAAWALLIAALGGVVATTGIQLDDTFTISGTESMRGLEVLTDRLPQAAGTSEQVLIASSNGRIENHAPAVNAFALRASQIDGVATVSPPFGDKTAGVASSVSADGTHVLVQVQTDASVGSITTGTTPKAKTVAQDLDTLAERAEAMDPSLTVQRSGNIDQEVGIGISAVELVGVAIAAIVLLITFGSLVAAGTPLIAAAVGVGVGMLGILATASFTDINSTTPVLAVMIGLAVGIDYALFIVSRAREYLADGVDPAEAAGRATATSGGAVVFAGTTVVIALAALTIIGIPFLGTMAIAAAATVIIAVLVANTFIPALLGLLGTKIFAGRVPGPKVPDPEDEKPTMGLRWVRRVRAHPWLHLIAGVVLLGILAVPFAQLRLAMPTDGTAKPGTPQREAYEITADAFGPGRNAPMIAFVDVANVSEQDRMPAFQNLLQEFNSTSGVENAQIVQTTDNGDAAQIMITPTTGATDEETTETLNHLRDYQGEFEKTGGSYGITGITPIFDDISERLNNVLIPYVAIVLGLAFIVLMLVFRSIWVPLIAAAGFALSMAATFGITVAIWQEGMFGIVDDPQPLLSFLPIMLIGLTFGLAMDYQVFLVTRMREGFVNGKTAGNATSNGFKHGARVVTAAALIMISVFAAFILMDEPFIKTMGFALAAGVLIDAFVVRMMIIPATMFVLDKKAWWFPRWLDKITPNMDIEGEALHSEREELLRTQREKVGETHRD